MSRPACSSCGTTTAWAACGGGFAEIEAIDGPETIRWAGAENLTSLSDPWLAAHEIGEQGFADAWRRAAGPE